MGIPLATSRKPAPASTRVRYRGPAGAISVTGIRHPRTFAPGDEIDLADEVLAATADRPAQTWQTVLEGRLHLFDAVTDTPGETPATEE